MPNYKEIEKILLEKLGNNNDSQVIVIKGKWGTGKTYLWNDIKAKLRGDDTSINNKCIWVSLCEELKKILKSTINFVISAFVLLLCLENICKCFKNICKCFKNRNNSVKTADAALSDKENQKEDNPKKDSDKSIKTAYVSLFNKKNLSEINKSALQSFYFMNKAESKFNKMKHWLGSFTTAMGENTKLSMALQGIDGLLTILKKDDLKNAVICFDDLERMNYNIPLKDFFGYVNELAEHNKCNVVLIMNDDVFFGKDKKNDSKSSPNTANTGKQADTGDKNAPPDTNSIYSLREEQYKTFKEKVIDFELCYTPDYNYCFDTIYNSLDLKFDQYIENELRDLAVRIEEDNMRVIKKSLNVVSSIYDMVRNKVTSNEYQIYMLKCAFVVPIAYWRYDIKSQYEYSTHKECNGSIMAKSGVHSISSLYFDIIFTCLQTGKEFNDCKEELMTSINEIDIYYNVNELRDNFYNIYSRFVKDFNYSSDDYLKDILTLISKKQYQDLLYDGLKWNLSDFTDNTNGLYTKEFINKFKELLKPSVETFIKKDIPNDTYRKYSEVSKSVMFLCKVYPEFQKYIDDYKNKQYNIQELTEILSVFSRTFISYDHEKLRAFDKLSEENIEKYIKCNPDFYSNSLYFLKFRVDGELGIDGSYQGDIFLKNLLKILKHLQENDDVIKYKIDAVKSNMNLDLSAIIESYDKSN